MGFEVDDPELSRNPQAMHKMVRDTMPVMDVEMEDRTMKVVSRHEDVVRVLRDPETFSSGVDAVEIGQIRPLIPLQIDPPDHAKYRKLLDPLFAPKRIALLEPATRVLIHDLIDQVIDDGQCNFHESIAEPLPSTVFLQLLGLPVERTQEFIELKDGIIRPPAASPEERSAMVKETGRRIYAVLEEVIAERQSEPRDDFISQFLEAEVDGHRLTPEDVQDIGYLFFLAGLDTVTASLDCMLAFLSQHPEHRQRLVD
ncbi:MAG: cytochrome P450, partial [Acidimicrobiales bacterium]